MEQDTIAAGAPEDERPAEDSGLTREQRHARWQARRPAIDHLDPGTVVHPELGRLPLFDVGRRVVVESRTRLLRGAPWLETIVGRVRSIDDDTGLVTLYDEEGDPRVPTVRYVSYKDDIHDIRLAPDTGDPFDAAAVERARRRTKKRGNKR